MDSPGKPDFNGITDPGRVRTSNEDQFLIAEPAKSMLVHQTSLAIDDSTRLAGRRPGYLFLVADGLGGAPEGARASRLAVDQVIRSVLGTMPWFFRIEDHEEDLEGELKKILEKCQLKLQADAEENPSREGMGTALTMAYVSWPRLYVVHVGDARCYLLRAGRLDQITEDHTVQAPPDGQSPDPVNVRKVLWNVIGGETQEVWPDVYKETLQAGDVLLLASDGLTRELPVDDIRAILGRASSALEASTELVRRAKEAGGRDNITVVVARFNERGPAEAPLPAAHAEVGVPATG